MCHFVYNNKIVENITSNNYLKLLLQFDLRSSVKNINLKLFNLTLQNNKAIFLTNSTDP